MNKNAKLQNISVDKIYPNPDNPRRVLGNLEEITESIKTNGLLQNLTVVPWPASEGGGDDKYLAVIGHRRLAASKLAGLQTVPCLVTEMDKQTQVATMMLENLQRNDLTLYEQAHGFQMMLNLGDDVKTVSSRTGFSETTVRRRLKLMELDDKKFRQAEQRGTSLFDYMRLFEVEDEKRRDGLMRHLGTNNFDLELNKAKTNEGKEVAMKWLIEQLNEFATEVNARPPKTEYVNSFSFYLITSLDDMKAEYKKPSDCSVRKYYYDATYGYNSIYLYADAIEQAPTPEEIAAEQERAKDQLRVNALSELGKAARELRVEFIRTRTNAQAKKHTDEICRLLGSHITKRSCYVDHNAICAMLGIGENELSVEKEPERYILTITYILLDHYASGNTWDWNGVYHDTPMLCATYELLHSLGYQMSDDEKKLLDGTHELYKVVEDEPEEAQAA